MPVTTWGTVWMQGYRDALRIHTRSYMRETAAGQGSGDVSYNGLRVDTRSYSARSFEDDGLFDSGAG